MNHKCTAQKSSKFSEKRVFLLKKNGHLCFMIKMCWLISRGGVTVVNVHEKKYFRNYCEKIVFSTRQITSNLVNDFSVICNQIVPNKNFKKSKLTVLINNILFAKILHYKQKPRVKLKTLKKSVCVLPLLRHRPCLHSTVVSLPPPFHHVLTTTRKNNSIHFWKSRRLQSAPEKQHFRPRPVALLLAPQKKKSTRK